MGIFSWLRGSGPQPARGREARENCTFAYTAMMSGLAYIPSGRGESAQILERTGNEAYIDRVQQLIASVLCQDWSIPQGCQALTDCDIEDFFFLLHRARHDALARGWVPRRSTGQEEWPVLDADQGHRLLGLLPLATDSTAEQQRKRCSLRRGVAEGSHRELLEAVARVRALGATPGSGFLREASYTIAVRAVIEHWDLPRLDAELEQVLHNTLETQNERTSARAVKALEDWATRFVGTAERHGDDPNLPSPEDAPPTLTKGTADPDEDTYYWLCPTCVRSHPSTEMSCPVCGTPRPKR